LPLRHVSAHPRRDSPRGGRRIRDVTRRGASTRIERRAILKAGLAAGGVLVVPLLSSLSEATDTGSPTRFAPNAFVRVERDGIITLVIPMAEMGQGIYTAHAMLLAEELEVGVDQVRVEHAPADDALYANPILHIQTTGLSASIRAFWTPLRSAGAMARTLLVGAAAARWKVPAAACRAEQGRVWHDASSRSLSYGELVVEAARVTPPRADDVPLKAPESFKLIGTVARRIEGPEKINGRLRFGIDVQRPGCRVAAIALSPVNGGAPQALDERAALAVNGVRQVIKIDEGIAVVADHTAAAIKGLRAARVQWDDGPNEGVEQADLVRRLESASRSPGVVARSAGDVDAALAAAPRRLAAIYQQPFLAHAAMEPMNCTIHVQRDRCEIWVGTQCPTLTQMKVGTTLGLPAKAVTINNHYIGGGFGRRLEPDGSVIAAKVARQVEGPVKVIWTREEDLQHDMYRPYYYDRISAGLDANGKPVAWQHRVAGSSIFARYVPQLFRNGLDPDAVEGAADPPYEFANLRVDYVRVEPAGVPTAFWRGVGLTHNVFVVESFLDELAHAASQDPFVYRKALLSNNPRALNVLELAAQKSGWGRPLPPGRGRGISLEQGFGSFLAQVAEVEVSRDGAVRVHRVVCAIDCGIAVNPDTIAAQMEGGTIYGLSAALYGEITLRNGRVAQTNFHDYRPVRMDESPVVETYLVKSAEAPGGIGETATAAIAPAVTNAIFAATSHRIRTLPISTAMASRTRHS
jgi:isoquinoline 1-oxidoreductase subunit beta